MKQTIEYGEAGVQLVLLDPLEKVFPDETPVPSPLFASIEALRGECAVSDPALQTAVQFFRQMLSV